MKVLQVIHGYPMRYNAGSEVYTQTLCHGLAGAHEVHVFTREENPFAPDFTVRNEVDGDDPRVTLHLVNVPNSRDRYRLPGVDRRFAEVLSSLRPDVVHVGHLNHLSTSLLAEAASRQIPILYTLHDYWLMCPRGQLMQMSPSDRGELWPACDGQEDRKCAERCYARYFSGAPAEHGTDVAHWTDWVRRRMSHAREGGHRCRVTFQLTFLESNVHELAAIVRLAAELGVDRVKGHHLWAHFQEIEPLSMRRDAASIRRWNEAVEEARAAAEVHLLPDGRRVLLENMFPLDEAGKVDLAPGGPCPFLGREAWVSAAGRFDPCCAPDAQRRTLGDFGSLHERSLGDIWNGAEYGQLIRTYRSRALCLGCNMRKPAEEAS